MGNTTEQTAQPLPLPHQRISVPSDANLVQVTRTLEANGVPVISLADACAACETPCDLGGFGSFPTKFDVDLESQMNGSTKPYFRQVNVRFAQQTISLFPSCFYGSCERDSFVFVFPDRIHKFEREHAYFENVLGDYINWCLQLGT